MGKAVAQAKKKQAKAAKVEKSTIAQDASLGIEFLFSASKLSETGVNA